MKLMHMADLHVGKRLGELPLIEDQRYILNEILKIADDEQPDAALIAGDIYDKAAPSAEAVSLFDDFLTELASRVPQVLLISGNHDSAERIAFGGRLLSAGGVHVSPVFGGDIQKVELADEYGPVCFWLLPFIKPVHVRRFPDRFGEIASDDYTGALRAVITAAGIDPAVRNVLIGHQYVTGGERSESEERNIGGLDNVDSAVFEAFDYVALGHLHRAQRAGSDRIRYSGAPMAYSFGEASDRKFVLIAELGEKDGPAFPEESMLAGGESGSLACRGDSEHADREEDMPAGSTQAGQACQKAGGNAGNAEGGLCRLEVRQRQVLPLREMRVLTGTFDELMTGAFQESEEKREAFVKAVLTDEEFIPDGIRRLRTAYPNILEVVYPRAGGRGEAGEEGPAFGEEKAPADYLAEFYRTMRGKELSEEQAAFADALIGEIWEETE